MGEVIASGLCDAKRFERFWLLDRLSDRVERLWPALCKAEHVFERLAVTLAAVGRDRVVLGIDHRVVDAKAGFAKSERVAKAGQRLAAVDRPVSDHPNDNSTLFGFLVELGRDL